AARVSPNEHALQVADELRNDRLERAAVLLEPPVAGQLIIGLGGLAQDRRLRLEGVNLIERAQDREHHIPVVDGVGNGGRKGLAKLMYEFLIVHGAGLIRRGKRVWRFGWSVRRR